MLGYINTDIYMSALLYVWATTQMQTQMQTQRCKYVRSSRPNDALRPVNIDKLKFYELYSPEIWNIYHHR